MRVCASNSSTCRNSAPPNSASFSSLAPPPQHSPLVRSLESVRFSSPLSGYKRPSFPFKRRVQPPGRGSLPDTGNAHLPLQSCRRGDHSFPSKGSPPPLFEDCVCHREARAQSLRHDLSFFSLSSRPSFLLPLLVVGRLVF